MMLSRCTRTALAHVLMPDADAHAGQEICATAARREQSGPCDFESFARQRPKTCSSPTCLYAGSQLGLRQGTLQETLPEPGKQKEISVLKAAALAMCSATAMLVTLEESRSPSLAQSRGAQCAQSPNDFEDQQIFEAPFSFCRFEGGDGEAGPELR